MLTLVPAFGNTGGDATGAGVSGATTLGLGTLGLGAMGALSLGVLGLGAAFLAATLGVVRAFLAAALTAFLALGFALALILADAFDLAFTFTGRALFLATLFLAAGRLAFANGRFFDLLFFAMVTLLLEIVRTRRESSPEKVRCHLCVTLESVTWIA
jgi:hypothetical protein